jgi:glutamine synthetase
MPRKNKIPVFSKYSGLLNEEVLLRNQYADLSEMCLYFIGGVIKHAKAPNAFTYRSTNTGSRI